MIVFRHRSDLHGFRPRFTLGIVTDDVRIPDIGALVGLIDNVDYILVKHGLRLHAGIVNHLLRAVRRKGFASLLSVGTIAAGKQYGGE